MASRAMLLLCIAGICATAGAQSSGESEKPWIGVVSGTNVYVRSGPGSNYYPCTKLNYPDKVTVVKVREAWLEILPPSDCFSVISTQYVKPDEGGRTGTVSGDKVHVRAGGPLVEGGFSQIHYRLNRGDKVQILGKLTDKYGTWYRIVPPAGAYYSISAQFVKRLQSPIPTTGPAAAPLPVATSSPARAPTTRRVIRNVIPPEDDKEFTAALASFRKAEAALKGEYAKPVDVRDLAGLLAKYRAIRIAPNSSLKPYVDARVQFLQAAIQQAKDIKAIEALVDDTTQKSRQFEAERTQADSVTTVRLPAESYAAQGVLAASEIFTGGPTAPRRFIVRDVKSGRINAYIQCTTGVLNLGTFVGKHVGVVGKAVYDRNLALDVVEASRIVVLAQDATIPAPPKPVIMPLPPRPKPIEVVKPAPQPQPKPEPEPKPQPAPEPKPEPKPEPQPQPVPEPQPTTIPVEKPVPTTLPATGLEMVKPETQPAEEPVDEKEYD